MMNIYAIICAAGAGSRMGQNKALCKLSEHETFLESIVRTLLACNIENIVVVTGAQKQNVREVHRMLPVIWEHNDSWHSTFMLESLAIGLKQIPEHSTVIHWPVDCLCIHHDDLNALIHAPQAPVSMLSWLQIPGHPVRLSALVVDQLRKNFRNYDSLRTFISQYSCQCVEAKYPSLQNCNDPDSLAEFLVTT